MILNRRVRETLTPIELHPNDLFHFTLSDGTVWELEFLSSQAEVIERDYQRYNYSDPGHGEGDISAYAFSCDVRINSRSHTLRREVGTQASFYEPWLIDGVHLWFDSAACIFNENGGFMLEKDWRWGWVCRPQKAARFVVQETTRSICPEPMRLWFDTPQRQLDITNCYNGEDCWMGPYAGAATHCGLDINMAAGTKLYAPFDLDDHGYLCSTAAGFNNNRWCGVRRWAPETEWRLLCCHLIDLLVPQHTPLPHGTAFATSAGTWVGAHEHTHFMFRVLDQEGDYMLDPWILFWQMFRDAEARDLQTDTDMAP